MKAWIIGLVAVAVLAIAGVTVLLNRAGQPKVDYATSWNECKVAVTAKAGASVAFPEFNQQFVGSQSDGYITFVSYFDLTSPSGAVTRTQWNCRADYGNGRWYAIATVQGGTS